MEAVALECYETFPEGSPEPRKAPQVDETDVARWLLNLCGTPGGGAPPALQLPEPLRPEAAPSQAPASELHCRLSSAATPPALAASYGCAAWVLEGVSRTKFGERLVYLHQLGGGQARYQRVVLA